MKNMGNARWFWVRVPCIIVALYFAVGVAYALWHFDAFGVRQPQFIRYIAVPAVLSILFAICAIWLPQRAAGRVSTYVGAIFVAVFAAQLVFSTSAFLATMDMLAVSASSPPSESDASLPPDLDLQRLNVRAGVQSLDQALLGGIPNVPVLMCYNGDEPVHYAADRYGFNNPDAVHDAQVDIAITGDSFVEGACLKPGSDFVSLVRNHHGATASLGMRSNGPLFELASVGRFGPIIRPKTVLIAFYEGNDLKDLARELQIPWLRASLDNLTEFGRDPVPESTLAAARSTIESFRDKRRTPTEMLLRTHFVRNFFALQNVGAAIGVAYPRVTPLPEEYRRSLEKARDITASWGGRLGLVYIPQAERYVGLFPPAGAFDTLRLDVLSAASDLGIDVVDLTVAFQQHEEPLALFAPDAHFSAAGAAVAAKAVNDYLAK